MLGDPAEVGSTDRGSHTCSELIPAARAQGSPATLPASVATSRAPRPPPRAAWCPVGTPAYSPRPDPLPTYLTAKGKGSWLKGPIRQDWKSVRVKASRQTRPGGGGEAARGSQEGPKQGADLCGWARGERRARAGRLSGAWWPLHAYAASLAPPSRATMETELGQPAASARIPVLSSFQRPAVQGSPAHPAALGGKVPRTPALTAAWRRVGTAASSPCPDLPPTYLTAEEKGSWLKGPIRQDWKVDQSQGLPSSRSGLEAAAEQRAAAGGPNKSADLCGWEHGERRAGPGGAGRGRTLARGGRSVPRLPRLLPAPVRWPPRFILAVSKARAGAEGAARKAEAAGMGEARAGLRLLSPGWRAGRGEANSSGQQCKLAHPPCRLRGATIRPPWQPGAQ
ncbi:hypothetical protein ACRRTK_010854 [Alexandromys fortis]